jgi:hypothetical protein
MSSSGPQPYTKESLGTQLNTEPPLTYKKPSAVVEAYSSSELSDLYNGMTRVSIEGPESATKKRKYDLDTNVTLPDIHPEFRPTLKDIVMHDIKQQVTQQYNTMIMTVTATISLGIIAYMVSNTSTPAQ